ncbi:MAG: hypothetical protein CBB77_02435 [Hyphomonas sp. TMED17]|nr:MAG: hypothetical protein CBB77_02435 [Hyphomonas sp. TMED17]
MLSVLSQGPIFIICLVLMLGLVVIVHELGHYLAGRYFGAAVESFSVGFGQPIYERTDRNGTRWRVNWIPLGGFVKFVSEAQLPADIGKENSGPIGEHYGRLSVSARSVVAVAGPVANFILAIFLFALIFLAHGQYESRVAVAETVPGQPAAAAGLQAGDVLVEVNGRSINNAGDVQQAILMTSGQEILLIVEREQRLEEITLVPEQIVRDNGLGQQVSQSSIGIYMQEVPDTARRISVGPIDAVMHGVSQTGFMVATTAKMMRRLVTGAEPLNSLSGPVAIGDVGRRVYNRTMAREDVPFGQRFSAFFWTMISISAAVSVGIGFFNLLPLPVLDGGHLLFNAYEAVTGKVLPEKVQEMALFGGLGLLMTLFVFITWGDILETGLFNRPAES